MVVERNYRGVLRVSFFFFFVSFAGVCGVCLTWNQTKLCSSLSVPKDDSSLTLNCVTRSSFAQKPRPRNIILFIIIIKFSRVHATVSAARGLMILERLPAPYAQNGIRKNESTVVFETADRGYCRQQITYFVLKACANVHKRSEEPVQNNMTRHHFFRPFLT